MGVRNAVRAGLIAAAPRPGWIALAGPEAQLRPIRAVLLAGGGLPEALEADYGEARALIVAGDDLDLARSLARFARGRPLVAVVPLELHPEAWRIPWLRGDCVVATPEEVPAALAHALGRHGSALAAALPALRRSWSAEQVRREALAIALFRRRDPDLAAARVGARLASGHGAEPRVVLAASAGSAMVAGAAAPVLGRRRARLAVVAAALAAGRILRRL